MVISQWKRYSTAFFSIPCSPLLSSLKKKATLLLSRTSPLKMLVLVLVLVQALPPRPLKRHPRKRSRSLLPLKKLLLPPLHHPPLAVSRYIPAYQRIDCLTYILQCRSRQGKPFRQSMSRYIVCFRQILTSLCVLNRKLPMNVTLTFLRYPVLALVAELSRAMSTTSRLVSIHNT